VRAIVPVNLRPPNDVTGLGNAFGLVYVGLPAGTDDPEARFAEVHRRVEAVKRSPDAFVSLRLLDLTGHLPYEEEQLLVGPLARKGSLVVTNVPGPPAKLHLAGATITHMTGYPPESGGLGLGMSLISYGGNIVIGAMADANVVADPDRLVDDTVAELVRLQQLRGRAQPLRDSTGGVPPAPSVGRDQRVRLARSPGPRLV
jgi:diacylglycerol O-acyltransferase / wax synthase